MDPSTAISSALSAATVLFGVVVTLALLVTGFWIGRKWLRDAGIDSAKREAAENFTFNAGGQGAGWNEFRSWGGSSMGGGMRGSGLHRGSR